MSVWKKLLEQKTEGLDTQFFMNTSTMDLTTVHTNIFHSNLERMKGWTVQPSPQMTQREVN